MMSPKLPSLLKPHHRTNILNIIRTPQRFQSTALAPTLDSSASDADVTTLPNGLRIASQDTGSEVCSVGVWISAGSHCETHTNNGVSKFLEHLIFKGTHNRSQEQLEKEIEGLGAHFRAQTCRQTISYSATCLSKDVDAVVDILGDVVQNPLLDEECVEKERDVMLHEMEEVQSGDLETVVKDYLHATAYQGTPLAFSPLGKSNNVLTLNKSDLQDYVSTNFTAPRIALSAAGAIDHNALVKSVESSFGGLSGDTSTAEITPCRYTGSAISDRNDDFPFVHLAIAVEGCGWTNEDHLPLTVAKNIIGNWNKGMAGAGSVFGLLGPRAEKCMESYHAFNHTYADTSLFGAHVVAEKLKIEDSIDSMQREFVRICNDITDSDVARAKSSMLTNLHLQLEDSVGVCDHLGHQVLAYGQPVSVGELCEAIEGIDTRTVKDVGMKYVYDKCPVVASIGPTEAVSDYNVIRAQMYWLRL